MYRQPPYFQLDNGVICHNQSIQNIDETDDNFETPDETVNLLPILAKTFSKKSRASNCRELLRKIRSQTFLIYETEALELLENKLQDVLDFLEKHVPNDYGFVPERTQNKKVVSKNFTGYEI